MLRYSILLQSFSVSHTLSTSLSLLLNCSSPSLHPPFLDCIKSVRRGYGETFKSSIPKEGSLLEFLPRGSPPESPPVVLWNQSDPESAVGSRGRVQQDGRVWVAEMVTQADQGNYTVRDDNGKVLSRSTLAVHGEHRNGGMRKRWRAMEDAKRASQNAKLKLLVLFVTRVPIYSFSFILNLPSCPCSPYFFLLHFRLHSIFSFSLTPQHLLSVGMQDIPLMLPTSPRSL